MITHKEVEKIKKEAAEILNRAGVVVWPDEIAGMEVADFGLSEIRLSGVQIITLVETDQIAVKLLVMLPDQTEPEHTHPRIGEYAGKEETIRCEYGELYVYGPGEATPKPKGHPPVHRKETYTMWHEYVLGPGEQVTFQPGTPHWFQGGPEGCVFWSFSTKVVDVEDVFTDPDIERVTEIIED